MGVWLAGWAAAIGLFLLPSSAASQATTSCLFRNPLCFYDMDVLSYVHVLLRHQNHEQAAAFFYGPARDAWGAAGIADRLAACETVSGTRRVGLKELERDKRWSLTYERTVLGTTSTFKLTCALVNDTCRIYVDEAAWARLFPPTP